MYHFHGLENFSVIKMSVLSKLIYRFNAITIKISAGFLVKIEKQFMKFTWNAKDLEEPKQF